MNFGRVITCLSCEQACSASESKVQCSLWQCHQTLPSLSAKGRCQTSNLQNETNKAMLALQSHTCIGYRDNPHLYKDYGDIFSLSSVLTVHLEVG